MVLQRRPSGRGVRRSDGGGGVGGSHPPVLLAAQAILVTMPFVVSVYMVRDWEAAAHPGAPVSEQAVGRRTGLLAAVFCAAQLVTSMPWGLVSDRIGRKVRPWLRAAAGRALQVQRPAAAVTANHLHCVLLPRPTLQPVLVVGNISTVLSVVWFGLSGSFWQALAARIVGGALNAVILAEKAIIGKPVPLPLPLLLCTQMRCCGMVGDVWGCAGMCCSLPTWAQSSACPPVQARACRTRHPRPRRSA